MLLAGRSTNLMALAGRLLFRVGRPVLVPDIAWPSYRRILKRNAKRANAHVKLFRIRDAILHCEVSASELTNQIVEHVVAAKCGGVFLPEISHDGIRLPIAAIVRAIRQAAPSVFVVVDGSQALGQTPVDLSCVPCDFYLSGCHKWIRKPYPLGSRLLSEPGNERSDSTGLR